MLQVPRLNDKCREDWNMKKLAITYNHKRGYCFTLPVEHAEALPLCAVQAVKKRSKIEFTTEELQQLNNRIREGVDTILHITSDLVEVRT